MDPNLTIPASFVFSQSSLQDYADCPRRFQLRYILKLSYPAVETEPALENERRQQEGVAFHRLVQQHLLGLPEEKLARLASTPNLQRWWQNYITHPIEFTGYAHHTETVLSTPLGNFRLLAKYDLIAIPPPGTLGTEKKAFILDWKTYVKRPKDEWMTTRWQTRVYRVLLTQAGAQFNNGQPIDPEMIEMVYWYADYPDHPARFPYSDAQFRRDWEAIRKLAEEIVTATSHPLTNDERKCTYCVYRSYCDRGVEAGFGGEADVELEIMPIDLEQIQEIEL